MDKNKSNKIICKTLNSDKITSDLITSKNIIIDDKQYVGFKDNDYDFINNIPTKNYSIVVKKTGIFKSNIMIGKSTYIGYNHNDIKTLNDDTILHINGDTEINGDLYVYNDINTDKNVNVEKSVNIGFENDILEENTSKLNVNGDAQIIGNTNIYGSVTVNNDIFIKKNSTFNQDIIINNSLILKSQNINNIQFYKQNSENSKKSSKNNNLKKSETTEQLLSPLVQRERGTALLSLNSYNQLLDNIIASSYDENQIKKEYSSIKFCSNNNKFMNASIISINKKFNIINTKNNNEEHIICFILAYAIHFKNKILNISPIPNTFTVVNHNNIVIKTAKGNSDETDSHINFFPNNDSKSNNDSKINNHSKSNNNSKTETSSNEDSTSDNDDSKINESS
jgi:hypothetical protein